MEDKKETKICSAEGCNRQYYAKGFCIKHYASFVWKNKREEQCKKTKDISQESLFSPNTNYESIYKVEPPLMKVNANFGYNGVIIRDRAKDLLQCHECGLWFDNLGTHVANTHKISSRDYKIKHGLFIATPLCSRRLSKILSDHALENNNIVTVRGTSPIGIVGKKNITKEKNGSLGSRSSMAYKNQQSLCPEQIKARYKIIEIQCGKVPTLSEIQKYDHQLYTWIWKHGGRKGVQQMLGIEVGNGQFDHDWDELSAIASVRLYAIKNGSINSKNCEPCVSTLKRLFGSYRRAMTQAGLIAKGRKGYFVANHKENK